MLHRICYKLKKYSNDFLYKNIKINYGGIEIITNFAAQYKEELVKDQIVFNAYIVKIGGVDDYFGHYEYDGIGAVYEDDNGDYPKLNQEADFYLNTNLKFVNGLLV
jgi:hypothetical protein